VILTQFGSVGDIYAGSGKKKKKKKNNQNGGLFLL